jgi:hypothetical protein
MDGLERLDDERDLVAGPRRGPVRVTEILEHEHRCFLGVVPSQ